MNVPRVNLAETPDFDVGGLRVSPARRQVCKDGECRELEPKIAQVLIALASASPAVVSRDRLIEQCWDGRIVGDDALNRCILALRHLAREFSPEPFAIETVPRVGYSLVAGPGRTTAGNGPRGSPKRKLALALIAALVVISAITAYWLRFGRAEAAPASIAVLPFRNLSGGDPYFAQGVGEEILGQLAREPGFRVAGSASSAQFTASSNPRDVGRKLGVDYILEGSVRRDAGRVRISASLLKTSDGMRLWSETYDRELKDILEIQSAIGQAVASGLKRQLVHSVGRGARAINGEAYALYLRGRGLIESQNPQSGSEATGLFKEAIRLDPSFAPAWASLADALRLDGRSKGPEGMIAILPQAQAAARRALQLDPNLAEAHGVLGQLLGYESPQGVAHLRRAADLAPRSAEGLMWRAIAYNATDDFAAALATYRRAYSLDPVSFGPATAVSDMTAEMGNTRGAIEVIRRGFPDDRLLHHFVTGRYAWFAGDFSEAARHFAMVADTQSRWARPSTRSRDDALFMIKLASHPPKAAPVASIGSFSRSLPRIWMPAAPSSAEWQKRNRSTAAALVYHDENLVAAKLMLKAGRARELAATYDSPTGLLGLRRGVRVGNCQFQEVPLVALALRGVGRNQEAAAMLRQADVLLGAAYRRGTVPTWFDEDAAAVWAVRGNTGGALDALERAFNRGWVHAGRIDLPNLEDEPAFQSLHDDPRFKTVLAKYKAHYAKERQEAARVLKIQA